MSWLPWFQGLRLGRGGDNNSAYDAFLSYSHSDRKLAEWLHRILCRAWVPGKRRRRIFRDEQSLSAGPLTAAIRRALADSRYLIVCCSEAATRSSWVDQEIEEFLRTHEPSDVLACQVGPVTPTVWIPERLLNLEREIGDEIFKPDLRGAPQLLAGREAREARLRALSLLAPLVGLADKDSLLDERKKIVRVAAVLLFATLVAVAAFVGWVRSDAYQIRTVLREAPVGQVSGAERGDTAPLMTWMEALLATGHLEEAQESARVAASPAHRTVALGAVSRHYVDAGLKTVADSFATEALANLSQIDDSTARARAGVTLFSLLKDLGREAEAGDLALGAVADAFKDPVRGLALPVAQRIAETAAQIGRCDLAILVADLVQPNDDRAIGLTTLSTTCRQLGAIDVAESAIKDALDHVRTLAGANGEVPDQTAFSDLLAALAVAGRLDAVLPMVAEMESDFIRDRLTTNIAIELGKAGRQQEALRVIGLTESASSKAFALEDFLQSAARSGPTFSSDVLDALVATVRALEPPEARLPPIPLLAIELARASRGEEALQWLEEGLLRARAEDVAVFKVEALIEIADSYAVAGQPERHRALVHEALAFAHGVEDGQHRSSMLRSCLRALVKLGLPAELELATGEALRATRQIKPNNIRFRFQVNLGRTVAETGQQPAARKVLTEAVETAQAVSDGRDRASYLWEVAQVFSEAGLENDALRTIELIGDDEVRSSAYAAAARGLAAQGRLRSARQAADRCSRSEDRLQAYAAIVVGDARRRG